MAKNDKSKWKSYNDQPLKTDEVLIPQMVDEDYARGIGANMANLRTWKKCGVSFLVMFVPVKKELEKQMMSTFNARVNELLDEKIGPNRHSRCMIPQPDGSKKVCPKKQGDNHPDCEHCPHRNEYERQDRSNASLNYLDEFEYAAGSVLSASDEFMVRELLKELLEELEDRNPQLAKIVTLGYAGYEKKEVLSMLGVKQSQAYNLWNEAERLTKEFLFK